MATTEELAKDKRIKNFLNFFLKSTNSLKKYQKNLNLTLFYFLIKTN